MATKTRRLADLLANIDDNSKVTSAGLLDATITAADLADDSVGAAEIIDDAVGAAAIADDAVGADALASNAVVSASIVDANITAAKLSSTALASVEHVKPHIQPGTLYPAWSGLLDNHTGYTFTDSSANGHAVVETVGDIHHNGGQKKIGSTSLSFPGTPDKSSLRYADSADWDFGTGAFTIECWVNPSIVNSGARTICARTVNDTTVLWMLRITASARVEFTKNNASGSDHESGTYSVVAGNWVHIAIVRGGTDNKVRMYADGVKIYTSGAVDTGDYDGSGEWWFGANPTGSQNLDGYIDEFRYVKGKAVYTDAFTPPTALTTTGGTYASATNIVNPTSGETKLLIHSDNSGHVGAYGTAQADGKKYYYTDIKGSKPIKDPRIGAHFGSQRHKGRSIQLLEQETATHGTNVYSVDGREWMRVVGSTVQILNNSHGTRPQFESSTDFIEITGYFNQATMSSYTNTHATRIITETVVNGGTAHTTDTSWVTGTTTPLASRYVDASSVVKIEMQTITSPQITTLRLNPVGNGYIEISNIELIAQDTTSTATKSQIQIPAQTVVSYGKKFALSAAAHHYNPFAFKTDGSTAWASGAHNGTSWPVGTGASANIDTATSLGLENWLHSSNYYKPYNGGRVVKWVDSSGNIKTSVTVMPPNAQNIASSAIAAKANASIANNTHSPTFSGGIIDHSLSEVAKTYHWREFGNGSANGGTVTSSTGGSYKDASMLYTNADIAYVMDDGLTSFSGETADYSATHGLWIDEDNKSGYLTFIGTGISWDTGANGRNTFAQNLPFGTHIIHYYAGNHGTSAYYQIDGVTIKDNFTSGSNYIYNWAFGGASGDITFHQPKMPPIPEDAVVLADYMLMADFVAQTTASIEHISKGVRRISASRDFFYDGASAPNNVLHSSQFPPDSMTIGSPSNASHHMTVKLPVFGTRMSINVEDIDQSDHGTNWAGTDTESSNTKIQGSHNASDILITPVATLGNNLMIQTVKGSNHYFSGMTVDTPIHTSSHYQTFETPYLHELVGGDRNMEQNNLIVTADGKSWDEVTRDTSYLGDMALQLMSDTGEIDAGTTVIMDDCRGWKTDANKAIHLGNKDFAIAYDRQICLRDGEYEFHLGTIVHTSGSQNEVLFKVNGNVINKIYTNADHWSHGHNSGILHLKRGDYVQVFGGYWSNGDTGHAEYYIRRLS